MNAPDSETRYFIRDDDAGALTDRLKYFAETFISRGLPVSYQIIPETLTDECAAWLSDLKRMYPDLVGFGQHGLRHYMMVGGKKIWREFGPERSLDEQRSDIADGLALLNAKLAPDEPIDMFTPPQHKYDRNTLIAVAEVGHRVFSAASYPALHYRLAYGLGRTMGLSSLRHHGISHHGRMRRDVSVFELSISVAVDDGGTVRCPARTLIEKATAAATQSPVVGFMFHHQVYDEAAGRATLNAIADEMQNLGSARFALPKALMSSMLVGEI